MMNFKFKLFLLILILNLSCKNKNQNDFQFDIKQKIKQEFTKDIIKIHLLNKFKTSEYEQRFKEMLNNLDLINLNEFTLISKTIFFKDSFSSYHYLTNLKKNINKLIYFTEKGNLETKEISYKKINDEIELCDKYIILKNSNKSGDFHSLYSIYKSKFNNISSVNIVFSKSFSDKNSVITSCTNSSVIDNLIEDIDNNLSSNNFPL